ncbi:hypothetical protein K402DRAFT_116598 [Aulographum hederae CBS 113979]|uniref:Uncharacterized protein n=1 Tax=Aulographum hederae CBS 113979 TaxID=1176131 RepID=A0A6G1GW40_9PEZI|nr:hypothetical protein K402DRAFT_116598 [Aulographum hederae CBS 113979]
MSAPGPSSSTARPVEGTLRRPSFTVYVRKMRDMLKRRLSSRDSIPTTMNAAAPSETETAVAHAASQTDPVEIPPPVTTAVVDPATSSALQAATYVDSALSYPSPIMFARNPAQQERAQALFAKYGLPFDVGVLQAPPSVSLAAAPQRERVQRPPRVRVHFNCHICNSTFGRDKTCIKCQHYRCKDCPRYPTKKERKPKEKATTVDGQNNSPKEMEPTSKRVKCSVPTPPSTANPTPPKVDPAIVSAFTGHKFVSQPKRQRVRRTCHKCSTEYLPPTALTCTGCQHRRCAKCPRDPAKKEKWVNGYPGDVTASESEGEGEKENMPQVQRVMRKPRMRVRWLCEDCGVVFTEEQTKCKDCGHTRCEGCPRRPPRKSTVDQDLRSLESRLHDLRMLQDVGIPVRPSTS